MAITNPNIRKQTLSKTLDFVISAKMQRDIHTMVPGQVVSYNSSTKRALVLPLIYRVWRDKSNQRKERLKARALHLNVPVVAPATGGTMMHQPLKRGDIVMLLFSERGLDEFKKTWELSEPTPGKFWDDPVAIRWGVEDIEPVDKDAFCIQSEDGETYFKLKDGLIEMKCGSKTFRMTPERGDFTS